MRLRTIGAAALAALALASCSDADLTAPSPLAEAGAPRFSGAQAAPAELFFSEYVEGSSNNKALEIFNGTGAPVDLGAGGYAVQMYFNGGTSPGLTIALAGTLASGDVFVVAHGSAAPEILAVADLTNGSGWFNGDDAVVLVKGGTPIDVIGQIGLDPGTEWGSGLASTADNTLRRKASVCRGDPDGSDAFDPAAEWDGFATNTFDGLGSHAVGSCAGDPDPAGPIASVVVTPATAGTIVGSVVSFAAAAADAGGNAVATSFVWSSADAAVATVDASGVATATGMGTTTITATAPNGVAGTAILTVAAAPPVTSVQFSELHYDNAGEDAGEAVEIRGPAGTDLAGWKVVLYNGNGGGAYDTRTLSGALPTTCGPTGYLVVSYPTNGIQNGAPDGLALVNASGAVVEFLSYEGTFVATDGPALGMSSVDIGVLENSSPVGESLHRDALGAWSGPSASTFGPCNSPGVASGGGSGGGGGGGGGSVSFSGRNSSDPPLPVGFQDQLFASVAGASGLTFTWISETPTIATVDQNGVVTARAAGTAVIRATASSGQTGTWSLPTTVATLGGTAQYGNNVEFGTPTDGDASDDFVVTRLEYTTSFNRNRGTPNWVSYDLDASHIGGQDRCDCFTPDPELPADFPVISTADYTGSGAAAGYGIDRGHLVRSFDRTTGSLDNATTYYFSNIVPQAADNNQGPWSALEMYLGDRARYDGREVYIVAGVAGNKGTLKNEGKVVIPADVWKVAVILPRDRGLADVHGADDLEVVAVIMPNEPGIRNVDWRTFETTVDQVEALSGYDLLNLLPDAIERLVESNDRAPVARAGGSYSALEGATVTFDGSASSDPDGDALVFTWSFGDGASGTGAAPTHVYRDNGRYVVTLTVTDPYGATSTDTTAVMVVNVDPAVGAFAGGSLFPGETYRAGGSFSDPGLDDTWTATVDYGDGSGTKPLSLDGKGFALEHAYAAAGSYTVTVTVRDDDGGSASATATVTVATPAQGIAALAEAAAAVLDGQDAKWVLNKLDVAAKQVEKGNRIPAVNQLEQVSARVTQIAAAGGITQAQAAALLTQVQRLVRTLQG